MSSGVTVSLPRSVDHDGAHRVESEVNGEILWFASDDATLSPSADAYVAALLMLALHLGVPLEVEGRLSPQVLLGVRAIAELVRRWWGVGLPEPVVALPPPARPHPGSLSNVPPPPVRRNALCFTGGVDAFYTLLRGRRPVHVLTYVHGYDIPLTDTWRMKTFEPWFRAVGAAVGARSVVVRTNLLQHPIIRAVTWERSHGGALAAIGHLLVDHVGRLQISSSYPYAMDRPWGTHWELDHLWSSSRLEVEHVGAEHWRREKLLAIAHEPLVQRYLRVCHENRSGTRLNCSECEKCVRTQLTLAGCGRLADFRTFHGAGRLCEHVDALPPLGNPDLVDIYGGMLDGQLEPRLRRAVQRLMDRSRIPASSTA